MKRAFGIVLNARADLSRLRILLRRLQEKKKEIMRLVRRRGMIAEYRQPG